MEQRIIIKAELIEFFSFTDVNYNMLDNYICLDLVLIRYMVLVLKTFMKSRFIKEARPLRKEENNTC